MNTTDIDDLWTVFYTGERLALAAARCPSCGGGLMWSPAVRSETKRYRGTQKHPMGLSIYCLGRCNYMLGHWDGIAPDWVVGIPDWDAFNKELRANEVA